MHRRASYSCVGGSYKALEDKSAGDVEKRREMGMQIVAIT